MSKLHCPHQRYLTAMNAYAETCSADPENWHPPDATEFSEIARDLLQAAEQGDMYCQYALATILHMGLNLETEEQFVVAMAEANEAATRWWIAAAKQGFWPAVDNLLTSGVGEEAQRIRDAFDQLEKERKNMVGSSHGMPVYTASIFQELSWRLYGKVMNDRFIYER